MAERFRIENGEEIPEAFSSEKLTINSGDVENELDEIRRKRIEYREGGEVKNPGGFDEIKIDKDWVRIEGASMGKDLNKPNQDAMFGFVNTDKSLFCAAVFDGVGGNSGSDIASNVVKNNILASVKELDCPDYVDVLNAIQQGVNTANTFLKSQNCEGDTTMSLVFGVPNGRWIGSEGRNETGWDVYTVNVGDSRVYFRNGNRLQQVTRDDSAVEDRLMSGFQKKIHRHRNVVTATVRGPLEKNPNEGVLSKFPYRVKKITEAELARGFGIDLTTDGYTDNFREDENLNEIQKHYDDALSPEKRVAMARVRVKQEIKEEGENGRWLSKPDDITVMTVGVQPITRQGFEVINSKRQARLGEKNKQYVQTEQENRQRLEMALNRIVGQIKTSMTLSEARNILNAWNLSLNVNPRDAVHVTMIDQITIQGEDFGLQKDQNGRLQLWKFENFSAGDVVKVERSNGEIEDGWTVDGVDFKQRKVKVIKYDDEGGILEKNVPFEKMRRLNARYDFNFSF